MSVGGRFPRYLSSRRLEGMPAAMTASIAPTIDGTPVSRPRRRHRFFPAMALLLLAAVVAGFWNTFFHPPADAPPLRGHLQLHGAVLTAWFALFAMQALLVATGRVAWHRRLGVLGLGLAVAVVASSLYTMAQMPSTWRAAGIDVDANRGLASLVLWGNFGALVAFSALLSQAVRKRRQPDAHRRLMLLAMFSIMSPALVRVAALPVFAGIDSVLLTFLGLLLLGGTLVAYDLATLRRVHRVTRWGVPFFLVVHLAPAFVLPGTALDDWMFGLIG